MNTPEIKLSIGYLAAEEFPKQIIDQELNIESVNAIANKPVATAINELNDKIESIEIPDVSDCVKNGILESAVNDINASLDLKANASDLENLATKSEIPDAYTKAEIDEMFGTYVDEVDTLLGGE